MTINTKLYAEALYQIAIDQDPLVYLDELDLFIDVVNSDQEIKDYFNTTYDEFDIATEILKTRFSDTFTKFLEVVYTDRLIRDIYGIRSNYEKLLMEHKYISTVDIFSKETLDHEVSEQILSMFKGKYPEPFRITYHTDKTLLGGYIIKINGDVYDTSFKSKLQKIKRLGDVINE